MGMPGPSNDALFTEVWVEYAISMLLILLRFFARWRVFGFEKFDLGDVFAGLAMVCYSLTAAGTPSRQLFCGGRFVLTRWNCRNIHAQYDSCMMQQNAWHELKHVLVTYGNNIGLNEQTAMQVPADKIADLTLGSKLAYVILLQE